MKLIRPSEWRDPNLNTPLYQEEGDDWDGLPFSPDDISRDISMPFYGIGSKSLFRNPIFEEEDAEEGTKGQGPQESSPAASGKSSATLPPEVAHSGSNSAASTPTYRAEDTHSSNSRQLRPKRDSQGLLGSPDAYSNSDASGPLQQVNQLLLDVQEEMDDIAEMCNHLYKMVQDSMIDLEVMVLVLNAMAAAENASTAALNQALQDKRVAASPRMTAASQLPVAMLAVRRTHDANLQELLEACKALLGKLVAFCRRFKAEAVTTRSKVNQAKQAVARAIASLQAAATALGPALGMLGNRAQPQGPMLDPWLCEKQLLQALYDLQETQDKERAFLTSAFAEANELETERAVSFSQVAATLASEYGQSPKLLMQAVKKATGLGDSADADLSLNRIPKLKMMDLEKACDLFDKVSKRQTKKQLDALEAVTNQVYSSCNIVRQGDLEVKTALPGAPPGAVDWHLCYCILTRAGTLYVFKPPDAPGKLLADVLLEIRLCNTHVEEGPATCFSLLPRDNSSSWWRGAAPRQATFRATSYNICYDWTASLNDAMYMWRPEALKEKGA